MSAAKKADRTAPRLLLSLVGRLERYMARAGLMAFMAEPTDTPAGGDPPAGGAGDQPAGDKPAADKPAGGDKPAGDAKPDGDKPAADTKPDDKKPADDKPAGAPEAYTDFTVPEGVEVNASQRESFKALAKELNLSQDGAQKLVNFQVQAQIASVQQTISGWQEAARSDKEFGGDKFDENLAVAKSALEKFATPEFRAFLEKTGLGFHPEMVRTFYRAGQAISQDGFVPGRQGAGGRKATTAVLYPSSQ